MMRRYSLRQVTKKAGPLRYLGVYATGIIAAMLMSGCASNTVAVQSQTVSALQQDYVTVEGTTFRTGQDAYYFVGANMWYGAYLGADADYGDRARLIRELDLLKSRGVTNLRILGGSETSPLRNSLEVTFRGPTDSYNEQLLEGMDFLLAEMAKRDMRAVIYLNNFWEWSGGMATYLAWAGDLPIVEPSDPATPWPAFAKYTAGFYENKDANARFRDYIKAVVTRVNTVTGEPYRNDPTIMAWQLANEPRPGTNDAQGQKTLPAFYRWIDETAGYIKALDPNHLISSGNEGFTGCIADDACFAAAHDTPNIDYLTFHMWPKNWGWIDAADMRGTFPGTQAKAQAYITRHLSDAKRLGKPIVLEEFGLERDGGAIGPAVTTGFRDRFYADIFATIEQSALECGPFAGSNFWSWGGVGRAAHGDSKWRAGDTSFVGDPPQEPQGLNSVFDTDETTLQTVHEHQRRLKKAALRCR